MRRIAAALVGIALAGGLVAGTAEGRQRTLTPDDLFQIEEIGDLAVSPDGRAVAYVRRRPTAGHTSFQQGFLQGNDRADIWVAEVEGGQPRNLTNGAADGSGYWMPVWSPDGQRLAMLSTKGGHVRLWVWRRDSSRLEAWSQRAVNMSAAPPFAWLDEARIAAILLPEGENPLQMTVERRAATVAMREWPKTWAGTETTASVLDSGVPAALDKRPRMQLAILAGAGAPPRILSESTAFRDLRVSPDRSHLAVLSQVAILQPNAARLLQHGASNRFLSEDRYELLVTAAAAGAAAPQSSPVHIVPNSVQWSRDGQAVALVGAKPDSDVFQVFRADRAGAVSAVDLPDLDPRAVVWTGAGRLLVSAESKTPEKKGDRPRSDWWIVEEGRGPRNLTATLKSAPAELLPERGHASFVGLADGDLWRIDPATGSTNNLTGTFEAKIASIAWPGAAVPRGDGFDRVIVGVQNDILLDLYRVDLKGAAVAALERPHPTATLGAYRPDAEIALFTATEPGGTYLTLHHGNTKRTLVTANEFLAGIAEGALKQIQYRSLEGQDLKAWVIHPPGFKEGVRYPVVAWVYAGSMARETPSILARLNTSHPLNLQLLAARGYLVVMPSMPLAPEREPSDPYMELPKGVLPALDKLIELGIADPDRLGVIGQSYGGYSTYGLITLTNRFKAAVSLAGLNDLVSLYGIFDMRSRYEPHAHERLFSQSIAESGQIRMGNPPWKDAGRYLRNSPLFYVDRVQTPLLIVQGDMDYVALQQGEQFFTALYRQGKRARFVRYWGEGHVFSSPANIRDMWKQVHAWFDEFLAAPKKTSGTQQ